MTDMYNVKCHVFDLQNCQIANLWSWMPQYLWSWMPQYPKLTRKWSLVTELLHSHQPWWQHNIWLRFLWIFRVSSLGIVHTSNPNIKAFICFIEALLKAPQGWHAVTYGFHCVDALRLTVYALCALSHIQTYDTCIQTSPEIDLEGKSLEIFFFFPDQSQD